MNVIWNQKPREQWDAAHAAHSAAMQQHWIYGASMRLPGMQIHRAEVRLDGKTVALAQFICRRYAYLFGVALCTRGPIWLSEVSDTDRRVFSARSNDRYPCRGHALFCFHRTSPIPSIPAWHR